MFYIIGIGLNEKGISIEGKLAVKKCKKIYLENYTVDFPYDIKLLNKTIGRKITLLERGEVESDKLVKVAKKENICLLVYGSPLFATTHTSLLEDCRKSKVKYKVIYAACIFDVVSEAGLQLYKFGKVSSMPKFTKNFNPHSYLDYVIQNKKINAHSLILSDIGLEIIDALNQLEKSLKEKKLSIDKIVVCSNLGNKKEKIYYGTIGKLKKKKIKKPFCFIIPSKLHFLEEEVLNNFKV